jgi:hypothetical protein
MSDDANADGPAPKKQRTDDGESSTFIEQVKEALAKVITIVSGKNYWSLCSDVEKFSSVLSLVTVPADLKTVSLQLPFTCGDDRLQTSVRFKDVDVGEACGRLIKIACYAAFHGYHILIKAKDGYLMGKFLSTSGKFLYGRGAAMEIKCPDQVDDVR